jgi:hypothetical protein
MGVLGMQFAPTQGTLGKDAETITPIVSCRQHRFITGLRRHRSQTGTLHDPRRGSALIARPLWVCEIRLLPSVDDICLSITGPVTVPVSLPS